MPPRPLSELINGDVELSGPAVCAIASAAADELLRLRGAGKSAATLDIDNITVEDGGLVTVAVASRDGEDVGQDAALLLSLVGTLARHRAIPGPLARLLLNPVGSSVEHIAELLRPLADSSDLVTEIRSDPWLRAKDESPLNGQRPALPVDPEAAPTRTRAPTRRMIVIVASVAILGVVLLRLAFPSSKEGDVASPQQIVAQSTTTIPPGAAPAASKAPESWRAILLDLDQKRSRAFEAADESGLRAVDALESPALRSDLETLTEFADINAVPRTMALRVRSVIPVTADTRSAVLLITDERPAFDIVSANDHQVIARQPKRGLQRWKVQLAVANEEPMPKWRVVSVSPV